MEQNTKKKIVYFILKLCVSSVLLFFVFRKADAHEIFSYLTSINPFYFLLSVLLYIVATFISAIRWGMLLDEEYPVGKLFSLYMIGIFFNNILPGMIGGDAVKIYYLYADTRKGGSSIGSVFMDRYIGFFTLLLIGLISGLYAFSELKHIGVHYIMPAIFVLFILASAIVFGVRIGRRFSVISDFYDYFHSYIAKKSIVFKTVLLSFMIQLIGILMVYVIARGLDQTPPVISLFVFLPLIWTLSSLPISIAGLGVREGAFVLLFGLVGMPSHVATSISFLWFFSLVATSLIGLVELFRYKKKPFRSS